MESISSDTCHIVTKIYLINLNVLTLTRNYFIKISCNFYNDVSLSYPNYFTNLYTAFITTILSSESFMFKIS